MTKFLPLKATITAYELIGTGEPLLLIHGAESDMRSLARMAAELAASATVVRYDQRGCGNTEASSHPHGILDLAGDAVELMDGLGFPKFSVFGTSLGGRISQAIASRHPDRVNKLILCNTWPLSALLADLNPAGSAMLQAARAGLPHTARLLAELFFTPEVIAAQPELAMRYSQWRVDSPRAALALERHPCDLAAIAAPTLLLSGQKDALVPTAVMQRMSECIATSQLIVLPEVGHAAATQVPAELARHTSTFLSPGDVQP